MNDRIFFFSLLFISINCNSQITEIKLSVNVKLDRVYLGLVSNNRVNTTDFEREKDVSLQSGLMLTYSLSKWLKSRSFGVIKFKYSEQTKAFTSYEVIYDIFDNINWHFGVVSTPTTELRPNPTTWESQPETNARSNIIDGRSGITVNYEINSNIKVVYGLFNHSGIWTNHLRVNYKVPNIVWYTEGDFFFSI